jgi:predicted regulator of Ras-like GTPase activity (Roadblock/LC7/MglB family)
MAFAQLFWILSATGALLFFCAGLAAGTLKGTRARPFAAAGKEERTLRGAGEPEAPARREESEEIARLKSRIVELEQRTKNHNASVPPVAIEQRAEPSRASTPAPHGVVNGAHTFQRIVERLNDAHGIRAAVLGDAMGLPVAAIGEQPESLAGFCGLVAQAASKARDFLGFGRIRRIVIEDERVSTLTACSIAGTDIFLATLTSGAGPDVRRMEQILNDVKAFMLEKE